jgi:membrane-bound serine protease (ClpP class)
MGALAVALAMSVLCSVGNAQPADQQPLGSSLGNCVRLRVPLPITEQAERQIRAAIEQAQRDWEKGPAIGESGDKGERLQQRPTLVLEFDTSNNLNGRGSAFETCLGLARFLQRPELAFIRRVAYLPPPAAMSRVRDQGPDPRSQLAGHALLVALACEELWMDPAATLSGVGNDMVDLELERSAYGWIAKRGVQWPVAFVDSLLDAREGVYRVQTTNGQYEFVDRRGLAALSDEGVELSTEEWVAPGSESPLTATRLSAWDLVPPPIVNRDDLMTRLEADRLIDLRLGEALKDWSAALLRVDHIDNDFLAWSSKSLRLDLAKNETNLLFVRLDTLGGYDLQAAGQLALSLADLGDQGVRTVALLPNGAKGAETIVALACDEIAVARQSRFGGNVTLPLANDGVDADLATAGGLRTIAQTVAEKKGRDWSLIEALAFGNQQTFEYAHRQTGAIRILSADHHEILPDREDWQRGIEVKLASGLTAEEAAERRIVDKVVDSVDNFSNWYSLAEYRTLQPTAADRTVQRIARFLSRPGIASLLLMFGFFLLMIELSSPGLGFPGFASACCLSLFFWANYLEGSAGALEILMFLLGLAFVLLEIFVVPGFGLFGIGGGILLVIAIILAGQDFVVPRSTQDLNRLVWSMSSVLGAMGGVLGAIVFIRYYMESVPVLNRLILKPPIEAGQDMREPASRYGHLLGRRGIAVSPLIPSGKVRFGAEVISVVTDGQPVDTGSEVLVVEVQDTWVRVAGVPSAMEPPRGDA